METQLDLKTKKRGGEKLGPVHLGMLVLSTALLTLAAIFLIADLNWLGVIAMILGIAVRAMDTRL